ncbi:MAG TPA: class I SAM-dependent methyltransferase [Azospirillaceae bacterium]|nr:class I SAM-dependent methyltransferase [Azospirillaceae bacterium]
MTTMMTADQRRQFEHGVLPRPTQDERARQEFVRDFKFYLATRVSPGNRVAYESAVVPAFTAANGRPPKDRHEVRREMEKHPYYKMWSSLQRTSQEMMWNACQMPVARQLDELIGVAGSTQAKAGSLRLNPDLKMPAYHTAVDIHCQPGGYHFEAKEGDVSPGAVYDRAVYLYAMGRMGPFNDDMGASIVNWLRKEHPNFKPKRILDMGCTVGHSTLAYVEAFPEAEVYAIDVAAPCLRYAHARAESLGKRVHFSQQNAETTDFEDGFFDLIVSHILVHETSGKAIRNIMKECNRLLTPGGMAVHAETPPYKDLDLFDAFMLDWDTRNNNEPYWGASHEIEPAALAGETGFQPENAFEAMIPSAFEAAEAERTKVFQGGDFAGGGLWYIFGVKK